MLCTRYAHVINTWCTRQKLLHDYARGGRRWGGGGRGGGGGGGGKEAGGDEQEEDFRGAQGAATTEVCFMERLFSICPAYYRNSKVTQCSVRVCA